MYANDFLWRAIANRGPLGQVIAAHGDDQKVQDRLVEYLSFAAEPFLKALVSGFNSACLPSDNFIICSVVQRCAVGLGIPEVRAGRAYRLGGGRVCPEPLGLKAFAPD